MNGFVGVGLLLLGLGAASGGIDTAAEEESAAQAGSTATYEHLADLAANAGFPASTQDDMVAIAMAESSGRLGVVSPRNGNGTRDRCAWQVNDVHGYDRSRLVSDPEYCAEAAKDVYDLQGLGAWTVYNTGAYRQYLDEAREAVRS